MGKISVSARRHGVDSLQPPNTRVWKYSMLHKIDSAPTQSDFPQFHFRFLEVWCMFAGERVLKQNEKEKEKENVIIPFTSFNTT